MHTSYRFYKNRKRLIISFQKYYFYVFFFKYDDVWWLFWKTVNFSFLCTTKNRLLRIDFIGYKVTHKKKIHQYFYKIYTLISLFGSHLNKASISFKVWMYPIQCMISIPQNRNKSKANKLSDDSDSIDTITWMLLRPKFHVFTFLDRLISQRHLTSLYFFFRTKRYTHYLII